MYEFDSSDLQALKNVDGYILKDVHGMQVAIGRGFDCQNEYEFAENYVKSYGFDDFAKALGYDSPEKAAMEFIECNWDDGVLREAIQDAFGYIYPEDYQDEAEEEWGDMMYDRVAGK